MEDKAMLRNVMMSKLSGHYFVVEAEDGEHALVKCQERRPHAVLLDLLPPKMDGFQFLEELRKSSDKELSLTPVKDYYVKNQAQIDALFGQIERILQFD